VKRIIIFGAAGVVAVVAAVATWYPGFHLSKDTARKGVGNHSSASEGLWSHQVTPAEIAASPAAIEQMSAGSTLGFTEVSKTEIPDSAAETKLELRIGLKKRANTVVDHTKVKIQVFFYDVVDDKDIKLTDANANYEWLTPKHDWAQTNPEVLKATYLRQKNKVVSPEDALYNAAAAVNPNSKSQPIKSPGGESSEAVRPRYLGYIVRLYYNDKLQAVRADPAKLLDLFPPPAGSPSPGEPTSPAIKEPSASPFESSEDFAKYALKLLEQKKAKVEPQVVVPTRSRSAIARYPWKPNIVTAVFWIGEKLDDKKGTRRSKSAWNGDWEKNYGGVDNPNSSSRRNYVPVAFVPGQNPFYCALPYNDVADGQFKPEAPLVIPWFKQAYTGPGNSVCQHRWLGIRKGDRTCYAQWEDCGPFVDDHFQYVFQSERPKPNSNQGAGLSVSPAVRDYLGLAPTDVTDWQFVDVRNVLSGPWRDYGENNHFVIARRLIEHRQ
jgi:hypothetical protein